jgi:hypothetical protein
MNSTALEATAVVFSPLAAGIAPGVVVALIVGTPVLVLDVDGLECVDPTGIVVVGLVEVVGAAGIVSVAGHVSSLVVRT